MNKHGLKKHLIGFLVLNKDLPPKNKNLVTVKPKAIDTKIIQAGKSSALALQIHSRHT